MTAFASERAEQNSLTGDEFSPAAPARRDRLFKIAKSAGAIAALLSLLLLPRLYLLYSPPYIEQAYCLWTEAAFLANSDFDYHRLRYVERHADEGGTRAYMYSVLATAIALLMRCFTPPTTFLVYHLFVIGCGATILWNVLRFLAPRVGWPCAWLTTVTLATVPLLSAQFDMLGMDVPMVAAASFVPNCIARGQYGRVALLSAVAFTMKNSGFLISAAAVGYLLVVLSIGWNEWGAKRRVCFRGLLINSVFLGVEVAVLLVGDNARTRMHFPRTYDLYFWRCCAPDFVVVFAFTLLLCVVRLMTLASQCANSRNVSIWRGLRQTLAWMSQSQGVLIYGWIIILLSTGMVLPVFFEPRYLCLPLLFLYIVLPLELFTDRRDSRVRFLQHASGWQPTSGGRRWGVLALTSALAFNVVNHNGGLYEQIALQSARGWGVLERSHEYWADHQSNIAAAHLLASESRNSPLLVSDQFDHFLAVPELGYVGYSLVPESRCWRFDADDDNLRQLIEQMPDELAVAHVPPQRSLAFPAYVIGGPREDDEILFDDRLRPPTIIYRRRFSEARGAAGRIEQYLNLLFADAQQIDPAARLAVLGWIDIARRYVAAERGVRASDLSEAELRRALAMRVKAARTSLPACWSRRPGEPVYERLAQILDERERYLRDMSRSLAAMPPLSYEARGLSIELPQRLLYLPRLSGPGRKDSVGKSNAM